MSEVDYFELYKVLNDRVQKEIEEMYDVHRLHFVSVTALITVCGFGYRNPWLNLICGLAGLIVCAIWWGAASAQEHWKLWWTTELARIENKLADVCIWRKLIYNERADDSRLMQELRMPKQVLDPPPRMRTVDALLRYRPVIFAILCALAVTYGAHGVYVEITSSDRSSATAVLPNTNPHPAVAPETQ